MNKKGISPLIPLLTIAFIGLFIYSTIFYLYYIETPKNIAACKSVCNDMGLDYYQNEGHYNCVCLTKNNDKKYYPIKRGGN